MPTLVVTIPFGDYAKGAEISDPAEVAAVLDANRSHVVVRAELPEPEPEPATAAKPAKADPKSADPG
jgi:hypothetical protein